MKLRVIVIAALWAGVLAGVMAPAHHSVKAQGPATNLREGCVDQYDPSVDYFPEKTTVQMAENFTVEYFNNYKVVTVLHPWMGADPATYVLVQCGTPAPDPIKGATVIPIPATTLVTMSTTFLPFVVQLGLTDYLVGHDVFSYVSSPEVRARIDAGKMVEVGEGAGVNVETMLDLDPSLILTSSAGLLDYDAHPALIEAGLPVVLEGDWMETAPLNRAEWVKFIALFYNRETDAAVIFDTLSTNYDGLRQLAATADTHPSVLVNAPWQGTWYLTGGKGYFAQYLYDAGADYPWSSDDSTGSLVLAFEAVFEQAGDADFWVNAGGAWMSLSDALAEDERFGEFKAFQDGNVWSNNLRLNDSGGNDFFESGVANPDVVLADLIAIFHPDLLPDHEFVYYRHLQ